MSDPERGHPVAELRLPGGGVRPLKPGAGLLVGSDDDCDIVLEDAGVAPRHCMVRAGEDYVAVERVDPEASVRVNGQTARHRILEDGDTIGLGEVELSVRLHAPSPGGGGAGAGRRPWAVIAAGVVVLALALGFAVLQNGREEETRERAGASAAPAPGTATDTAGGIPQTGRMRISSFPRGASVFVGSERVGATPVTIEVPAGHQEGYLRAPGFEVRVFPVDVTGGETHRLHYTLHCEDDGPLRERVAREPDNAGARFDLGCAFFTMRKYQEGRDHLEAALRLAAGDAGDESAGLTPESIRWLYLSPPVPDGLDRDIGPVREALRRAFAEVVADHPRSALLDACVAAFMAADEPAHAVSLCETALSEAPGEVGPYRLLAEIYRSTGRPSEAASVLALASATCRPAGSARTELALAWGELARVHKPARGRALKQLRAAHTAAEDEGERKRLATLIQVLVGGSP
ncbi:MAG: FHA domain-containing protein [bacterium]